MYFICLSSSIHVVEKVKDKDFKLEMTWVGKQTNGMHKVVNQVLYDEAVAYGLKSVNDDDDDQD